MGAGVTEWLAHPAVQSVLVPLAVCLVVLPLFRRHPLAAAALPAALLAAAVLVVGTSGWPPRTGMHKLPWLLGAILALGIALDIARAGRVPRLLAAGVFLALALGWLAWPQRASASPAFVAGLAALLAGGVLVVQRLARAESPATRPAAMLGVACATLAVVAFQAGSLSIAQLAGALGVACGVFCLDSLRLSRVGFAAAGAVAAGGAWVLLVAATGLLTDVSFWALVPLTVVFFADSVSMRLGVGTPGGLLDMLVTAVLAAVPAVVAVALAIWLTASDDLYYQ